MKKYYPLYPEIDNKKHSLEPYSSSSFCYTYSIPSIIFNINSPYQDIVTNLQNLTHEYNTSSHLPHQHKTTTNQNSFPNDSIASSSDSTSSFIPLTFFPIP